MATFLLAGLAACAPAPAPSASAQTDPPPFNAYLSPPQVETVTPSAAGVRLAGHASPGARVRLATPTGQVTEAPVALDGAFVLDLPPAAEPRIFGLSMSLSPPASESGPPGAPRIVQSQGYLIVLPEGQAALLRSGSGTVVVGVPKAAPRILAIDHDREGGAIISGAAAPGEAMSVRVDGITRGQAPADAQGRFIIPLSGVLAGGNRQITVTGARSSDTVTSGISAASPLTTPPFRAERTTFGWRIDWMTPGGGLQTSLIMNRAES